MRKSGDKRIRNVVYEGRVASGTYADQRWVWRSAPGLGHAHHIHISFDQAAKLDGAPFLLPILDIDRAPAKPAKPVPAKTAPARKTAKKAAAPKP